MRLSVISGLVALAVLATPVSSEGGAGGTLSDRLARIVEDRMAADGVAGAVVVLIEGGAPVWTGAFGMADATAGWPVTAETLFRVESISKPVTAWGAMRLAATGRLDLDAPIDICLTRWRLPEGAELITPRALLSHSAGIGLGDYAARFPPEGPRPTLPEHIAQDFSMIATQEAGFSYSDTRYNLLELVIEDCTGEDFAALMAREVLSPLGMPGASFDWTGADLPVGHDLRGRPVAPYVYPGRASGGLHASAADIARFAIAGMAGAEQSVLSPEGVAALHGPRVAVDGANRGSGPMWAEYLSHNLIAEVPVMQVPMLLISGAQDRNTPVDLVQDWFAAVEAPQGKRMEVIAASGHAPFLTQTDHMPVHQSVGPAMADQVASRAKGVGDIHDVYRRQALPHDRPRAIPRAEAEQDDRQGKCGPSGEGVGQHRQTCNGKTQEGRDHRQQPQAAVSPWQPPDRHRPLRHARQREEEGAGARSLKQDAGHAAGGPEAEPGKQRQRYGDLRQQDQRHHDEPLLARSRAKRIRSAPRRPAPSAAPCRR